ncbi:molybdopterin cofactor-binding domain-containing protein [Jiulongibacter sp. NS-SX5]|uniref:molybdopterin cofactor-binding domain-containing protein n=1 Tax=Jiulongibacter sp. NS-SX5 TaxID=3463854 RepID=UPI004059675F
MKKVKTQHNRRSFLKISAASGGGLLVGFSWFAGRAQENETIPEEWYRINGYIKLGSNNEVIIYSPNPEIGQNVRTSMPMIVAEELDIPWEQVTVEQAPLNTGFYQNQFSGGSLSIRLSWKALRMAGATAKHMLAQAAANEWGVELSQVKAEKGMVSEINGKRKSSYGDLAAKAVELQVPEEVELKNPKSFELIGTSQKNVDGSKIVSGQPLFGLDFHREGMKLAMVQHPPAFGMTVKSFNAEEIKKMNGVSDAFIIDTTIEEPSWSDERGYLQLIAIVGDSTWQLMNAKKALKVKWETLSPAENNKVHQTKLDQAIANGKAVDSREDGDVEAAFAKATKIIESEYTAPFLAHSTMEPMNFFANVTEDSAELIGPVQTPESLETSVSKLLDMPIENITVNMTRIGGGFGRRLYVHYGVEAAAISNHIKAPVKLFYSREDDMTQGTYRPAYKSVYKAGLDENNQLIAFSVKGAGLPEGPVFPDRYPAGAVENYSAHKINADTNITTGAWRAPRSNFTAGAEQAFIDEVAEAAGKDPIEFRLELFDRAKQNPVGKKYDYDAERYAGVLKLVKEKSGWGKPTPGIYRGVAAYFCHSTYVAEVFDIAMVDGAPKVKKVWAAVDCGIVVNKDSAKNIIEGGVIDGIGHAMYSHLDFENGKPQQENFNTYQLIRHHQAPEEIEVFFVENEIDPTGLGEPGLPPAIGALANALYQATGQRYYNQPFATAEQKSLG